jgi:general secretion pathway protein A
VYHRFFNLSEEPFGVTPDPRFFFASSEHTEAAACLYYSVIQRRGFAALIAAPGLGKTSVVVSLLPRLRERADVVFLVHPQLDGEALVESVLQGLGIGPHKEPAKRAQQLAEHLLDLDRRDRSCVVVLDEAQNLSFEALESVRMLSNYEMPGRKLVQFILVGQPALGVLLLRPECEQIRQRINIIARLQPLTAEYVSAYIQARMKRAGGAGNPFTADAVKAITAASGGVPRIVNTLCFNALSLAFAENSTVVTESHVVESLADLRLEIPAAADIPAFTASRPPEVFSASQARSRVTRAVRLQTQRSNLS